MNTRISDEVEARAREILAKQCEKAGWKTSASRVRAGESISESASRGHEVVIAALVQALSEPHMHSEPAGLDDSTAGHELAFAVEKALGNRDGQRDAELDELLAMAMNELNAINTEIAATGKQQDGEVQGDAESMRAEWLAAGGRVHGPIVETVTMVEADYFRFRVALAAQPSRGGQGDTAKQKDRFEIVRNGETEDVRIAALADWLDQCDYRSDVMTVAAATLRALAARQTVEVK